MTEEFTLVKGKRYQAKIHLPGFEDMASNEKIIDMLTEYGFTDIEVIGYGRTREGSATWSNETVTGPLDRHIIEISEVVTSTPETEPVVVPDAPPVFEKFDKKVSSNQRENDEENY